MLKLAGETDTGILEAHEESLTPHLVETLPVLLKGGNLLHIPTNAAWDAVLAGSGATNQQPMWFRINTGVTASSKAALLCLARLLNVGATYFQYINWDKKIYLIFNIVRHGSDAQIIARVQLKQVTTEGVLAAKGIGLRAENFALYGASYGTEVGSVDLSTTLTDSLDYQIMIIHYPGSKIEWYVDGVLKGTQSTAAKIPGGEGSASGVLLASTINGEAGGTNCYLYVGAPKIWQER